MLVQPLTLLPTMTASIKDDPRKGLPSASGIERIVLCPGSWAAEGMCPREGASKDALAGTVLHAHMENGTMPEDAEEAEAIQWCRDVEMQLAHEFLGGDPQFVLREQRLWMADDVSGKDVLSGVADVVFSGNGKALIIDYKFGRGDVTESRGNWQLGTLAMLVNEHASVDLSDIYCAILQPFVSRQRPQVVRYTSESLMQVHNRVLSALHVAFNDNAALRPSPRACKYCRASLTCPSVQMGLSRASSADVSGSWDSMTSAQKVEMFKLAKQAESFAKKVIAKIKADLISGKKLGGLALSDGKREFTVTDASKAFSILNNTIGMNAADFAGCCKVGITALDKAVHSLRSSQLEGKVTVKDSKEWLRAVLGECAEMKTSEGSIQKKKAL